MIIALSIIAGLIVINMVSNAVLKYQKKKIERLKKMNEMAESLEREMIKADKSRLYISSCGYLQIDHEEKSHYVVGFYDESTLATYTIEL